MRSQIVAADPASAEIILPYVRGQDIERWSLDWRELWMVFTRRGIDIDQYPGVRDYLQKFRERLEPQPSEWSGGKWPGRKAGPYQWFEIQDSIEYWQEFSKPKIMYQDIAWRPAFCLDVSARMSNNTVHFIVTDDRWILAVLNSPVAWWYSWRSAQHGKDEALRLFSAYMRTFPIPVPRDDARDSTVQLSNRLCELSGEIQQTRRSTLDWLRVEHAVEKASLKLQSPTDLDSDAFVAEVKRIRGKKNPLSAAALKSLRDEYARTIVPAQALVAEAAQLERRISDAVNAAYGLTPDEIDLMWSTAPPRMPLPKPN
jgi:hypothetical protein